MDWETTASLLTRLADPADESGWELVCERFHAPIARFARRLGAREADAEDVAQETLLAFVNAYRAGSYDATAGRLNKWLFGIAYRCTLRSLRRAQTPRPLIDPPSGFLESLPDEATATASFDLEWERGLLAQCERLARKEFEPETFRAYECVVHGERAPRVAARELGVSIQSVYNAKHRVLKRIRELRARMDAFEA